MRSRRRKELLMKRLISRAALPAALLVLLAALVALRTAPRAALAAPAHGKAAASQTAAVDAAGLRRRLAALKGKVVVLNVWATWCGPCVMEFPELVKFERTYRGRGVTVIALSMDDPKKARGVVPPFLAQQRVHFPVYTLKPVDSQTLKPIDPQTVIAVVDKGWEGAVPMTYVFDRSGQMRTRLTGARRYEAFEDAVRPLLRG
jgi:thiol-disulfide isomerase/thioredoxin